MKHRCLTRITAIIVSIIMVTGCARTYSASAAAADSTDSETVSYTAEEYSNEMIEHNYTIVSAGYTAPVYTGDSICYAIDDTFSNGNVEPVKISDYDNSVLQLTLDDTVTLKFEVEQTAQYFVRFDYRAVDDTILPSEFMLQVNGEYPFYETRRLVFESTWIAKDEKSYDRYGKEIVSMPEKLIQWESKYIMDASYRYSTPLKLELQAGTNEFTFIVNEGNTYLGNFYLEAVTEVDAYTGSQTASGDELIVIQAEDFLYRNDSSIRAVAEYDVDVEPYEVTETLLNTIDADSFKTAGQKVTYEFVAEKDGYYNISLNYRQSDKNGFPVFVDVAIDGIIPNEAFTSYPLDYTTNYKTITMQDDDGNPLSCYLEAGVHTISYTINIDNIRNAIEIVERIMNGINDLSLEITKVAGTNKDKYRDLTLTKYIPDVEERLNGWADEMEALHKSMLIYNPGVKTIAAFSSLDVAASRLRDLAEDPNDIPYRISELSTSVNSATQYLANMLDTLNKNKIAIDRIYIHQQDAELPKDIGFFKSLYLQMARFIASFTNQAYSTTNVNEDNLQVWVNRPRQYLEIMQKMIDEEFTPLTGISVDLSLMPDQYKLTLANASGDAPDIATGINYAIPFDLAIRGAIKDLTEFSDYEGTYGDWEVSNFIEVAQRSSIGLHVPATIGDGIYALPETMNFWVLFYRTDILEKLSIEVPNTIQDVIDLLPDLQIRGLNFYYPTAGMTAMRNFHGTTPLLFQNGATLYGTYAGNTTLSSEAAVTGFTMLTELFTIYNLPVDIPNFYQHFRNGDLPIGIGDYAVYNLINSAAPEIANSWDIALVPGVEQEDGTISRYTSGGAESTIMFKSTAEREEQAWVFMDWWSSAETQAEFGQTLQNSYGDEYIWHTANLEAFESLPWDSKDKQVILEQAQYILEAPRILGTYMMERELSNAFNDVVVNGKNLRTRLDAAVKTIDRETERKLEEFGYGEDEYVVPTIDTVKSILGIQD